MHCSCSRPQRPHIPASAPSTSTSTSASVVQQHQQQPLARAATVRAAAAAPGGGDRPNDPPRRSKPERKARKPGLFEVKVVTPPPRSLGVYALPPLTHNGEQIEIEGTGYVVTSLVLKYKLQKGRYVRDHSRLEVQPTGRYFLNMMLDNIYHGEYMGETGEQD